MSKFLQIAIDGPVGAGKSTVAQQLSEKLGFLYVDTGAMYRAVAMAAKREGIDWNDEAAVSRLVPELRIKLRKPTSKERDGRKVTVYLDSEDVSWKIREPGLGEGASIVSQYRSVRKDLVKRQQKMSKRTNVVMEGRDIGTRVLPQAELKIYMDADLAERVRRKKEQLAALGQKMSQRKVRESIVIRDNREMTRQIDPLRHTKDAWLLDTTHLSVEEVVDKIVKRVRSLRK